MMDKRFYQAKGVNSICTICTRLFACIMCNCRTSLSLSLFLPHLPFFCVFSVLSFSLLFFLKYIQCTLPYSSLNNKHNHLKIKLKQVHTRTKTKAKQIPTAYSCTQWHNCGLDHTFAPRIFSVKISFHTNLHIQIDESVHINYCNWKFMFANTCTTKQSVFYSFSYFVFDALVFDTFLYEKKAFSE